MQTFQVNLKTKKTTLSLTHFLFTFKKLVHRLQGLGLRQLTETNFPINCKKFIPERSEVTVGLTVRDPRPWKPTNPDDKRWESDTKSFSKVLNTTY